MKWAHLPEAGGLYAQNPKLLDRFHYIFQARAKEQAEEERRRKAKSANPRGKGLGTSRPG